MDTERKRPRVFDQAHAHGQGIIQDNHLKALVTSLLFQARVEPSKRGRGSYQRKARYGKRWEPGQQRMQSLCC